MTSTANLCPRCRLVLEYRVEVELGNGGKQVVTYYYRCPRCGYRRADLSVTVRRVNGAIVLEVEEYMQPTQ